MSVANNIKASPTMASQNAYWLKAAIVPKWPRSASTPRTKAIHQVMTFGGVSFIFVSPFHISLRSGSDVRPGCSTGSDNLQNESSQASEPCNRMELICYSTINTPRLHPPAGECLPPPVGGGSQGAHFRTHPFCCQISIYLGSDQLSEGLKSENSTGKMRPRRSGCDQPNAISRSQFSQLTKNSSLSR